MYDRLYDRLSLPVDAATSTQSELSVAKTSASGVWLCKQNHTCFRIIVMFVYIHTLQ